MNIRLLGLIFMFYTIPCFAKNNKLQIEKQILDDILSQAKYDKHIRPSGTLGNGTGPVQVKVNIFLRSISGIDDMNMEYDAQITFRQQWRDVRLKYDDRSGLVRFLTLKDPSKIWQPDLFFSNEKQGHFHNIVTPNVLIRIHPDGAILYSVRISLTLSCPMDLRSYPLDKQACSMVMASYGYTTEDILFLWKEVDPVQVTKTLYLPQFTLNTFWTDYCTSKTNTGEYSCLKVDFLFARELGYYLVQVYIPFVFLVILSWIPFWIDHKATNARVGIWVTILLTMTIMGAGIQAKTPAVSYTRSIDVWTGTCVTFLFAVVIELAIVNMYVVREEQVRKEAIAEQELLTKKSLMGIEDNAETNQTGGEKQLGRFRKWLSKYKSRSLKIDVISRFTFPVAFILFNLFYWSSYSSSN